MDTVVPTRDLPADWRDLFALTKPRVMTLVVFTGLCGLLAAPVTMHPVLAFTASSASRLAQAGRVRSTCGTRRTSTPRCGGPRSGRCRAVG
jgi:heme O synthase-like polyprenyltransferase